VYIVTFAKQTKCVVVNSIELDQARAQRVFVKRVIDLLFSKATGSFLAA
jgi:hypothetical protein